MGEQRPAKPSGPIAIAWLKVSAAPERWERPGFGAIEARDGFWAVLPLCGHRYESLSLAAAREAADQQAGLCSACCLRNRANGRGAA